MNEIYKYLARLLNKIRVKGKNILGVRSGIVALTTASVDTKTVRSVMHDLGAESLTEQMLQANFLKSTNLRFTQEE